MVTKLLASLVFAFALTFSGCGGDNSTSNGSNNGQVVIVSIRDNFFDPKGSMGHAWKYDESYGDGKQRRVRFWISFPKRWRCFRTHIWFG
jgi:hypothetical protein